MNKSETNKILLAVLGTAILLFILYAAGVFAHVEYALNYEDNHDPAKKAEMVRIIREAGDLAPIPSGASVRFVRTEGNPFDRSFFMHFEADPDMIRKWLKDSKGIKSAEITGLGSNRRFVLKPKHGCNDDEVIIIQSNHSISVHVE